MTSPHPPTPPTDVRTLDYAVPLPPPEPRGAAFAWLLMRRTAAFVAVAVAGWLVLMHGFTVPVQNHWVLGAVILVWLAWVFTLVWICRGGWILGSFLGLFCGVSIAGYGGGFIGPFLGLIAGAGAMPLTQPRRPRRPQ